MDSLNIIPLPAHSRSLLYYLAFKEGYQLDISCKEVIDEVAACSLPAGKMFKESNFGCIAEISHIVSHVFIYIKTIHSKTLKIELAIGSAGVYCLD